MLILLFDDVSKNKIMTRLDSWRCLKRLMQMRDILTPVPADAFGA